jgi:hypothetical protein
LLIFRGFWLAKKLPEMIANGRFFEFVKYIQKDMGKGGKKIFKTDIGQMFKLSEWSNALKVYSKGNARKLFFKI